MRTPMRQGVGRVAPVAMILHPHPSAGGTMNNRIVQELYEATQEDLLQEMARIYPRPDAAKPAPPQPMARPKRAL